MQGSVGAVGPVGQAVKWCLLCQKVLEKKKEKIESMYSLNNSL